MPGLILPQRLTQQPQQAAPIDWGDPLARGLASYMPSIGNGYQDAADNRAWSVVANTTPIAFDTAPRGRGMRIKGATPSYVTRPIPAAISSSATQPLTIRFRLYFRSLPTASIAIMSWGSVAQDGAPRFYIHTAGSVLQFFFSTYHWNPAVVAEREYVVTHTFDGATMNTYMDGVLIGTASGVSWAGNFASLYLGMGYDGQQAASDFLLSDFAMWNRALSAQEVVIDAQNLRRVIKAPQRVLFAPASGPANATGTLATTLANATLATSGAVTNAGSFQATLSGTSMAASGQVATPPSGSLASTLAGAAMAASGQLTVTGLLNASLAGCTMVAAGTVDNRGALATALSGAAMTASGTVAPNVSGAINTTLAGATMAAYGYNGVPPVLAGSFHRLPKNPRHVQRIS